MSLECPGLGLSCWGDDFNPLLRAPVNAPCIVRFLSRGTVAPQSQGHKHAPTRKNEACGD
jgi:hypothetical protein